MTNPANPPVTASAAAHAARIRAGEEEFRAARSDAPAGQSTAERYAARALAGAQADEALREEARRNDLRARGQWVPDDEEELDEEEAEAEFEDEGEEDDEEAQPLSTAERYAAMERKRQAAERKATLKAHRGAVQTLVQPHQYANVWQKPAS
ncbi:hypothetical protein ACWCQW_35395 [Streptomyces mirabilis]